jgi:hypothetical protein
MFFYGTVSAGASSAASLLLPPNAKSIYVASPVQGVGMELGISPTTTAQRALPLPTGAFGPVRVPAFSCYVSIYNGNGSAQQIRVWVAPSS